MSSNARGPAKLKESCRRETVAKGILDAGEVRIMDLPPPRRRHAFDAVPKDLLLATEARNIVLVMIR